MNKSTIYLILAVMLLFAAAAMAVYPLISNYSSEMYASKIQTEYYAAVGKLDDGSIQNQLMCAYAYNELIAGGVSQSFSDEALNCAEADYLDILNIGGDGIMGYVDIPVLDIHLPIYHGTAAETLENGIGHVIGSSLPVGGESTHAVLSGHSGMAGQRMFSDLDKLQKGDVLYLHILNDTLAYEVDEINTVLPSDTELLSVVEGEDHVTLITCTPFGVNTHRLLVRGVRIPYEKAAAVDAIIAAADEPVESTWMSEYLRGLAYGIAALTLAGGGYFSAKRLAKRRTKHEKND